MNKNTVVAIFAVTISAALVGSVSAQITTEEDTRGICTWEPVIEPVCTTNGTFVNHCFASANTIIHDGVCEGHEELWE
jgi:hypothetical protein